MDLKVKINPKEIATLLVGIVVILQILSLLGQASEHFLGYGSLLGYVQLTDVNGEGNLPAWFSANLLLVCGFILGIIGALKKQMRDKYARHWIILSGVFVYLSLDEAAEIHEMLIAPLRHFFGATHFLYSAWVLIGGAFVGIMGIFYWRFLTHLPRGTRRLFLLSACLYVGGAIGVEMIHGNHLYLFQKDMLYEVIASVEETMEMVGIIVFFYALLSYLPCISGQCQDVRFVIETSTSTQPEKMPQLPKAAPDI